MSDDVRGLSVVGMCEAEAMPGIRWADGPPPGYLAVAGLDEVSGAELAARRAWLLAAFAAAPPDADLPVIQAAGLVLVAVTTELAARARVYAADKRGPRWCACSLVCRDLAAIDSHLDQFAPDDESHYEVDQPPAVQGRCSRAGRHGTSR